jgi:hypothetical protein
MAMGYPCIMPHCTLAVVLSDTELGNARYHKMRFCHKL